MSVLALLEPKETKFEKLSGVDDFGGAKGFGGALKAPEPWAERGVFRPKSWGGGVGRNVG